MKCSKCGIEKELSSEFYPKDLKKGNECFRKICKKCRYEAQKKLIKSRKNLKKPIIIEKECLNCKEIKKVSKFNHSIRSLDGYNTQCKECCKKREMIRADTLNGCIVDCLRYVRIRVRKKEMENDLTKKFITNLYCKQKGLCAISKIKMKFRKGGIKYRVNPYRMSIDRIDSSKGYTQDNVQLVCGKANNMKNDMDQDEFILFCKEIAKNN